MLIKVSFFLQHESVLYSQKRGALSVPAVLVVCERKAYQFFAKTKEPCYEIQIEYIAQIRTEAFLLEYALVET